LRSIVARRVSVGYRETKLIKYERNSLFVVFVEFEVLTAIDMKSSIFWDVTPCSPVNDNIRFVGTYRLHLRGERLSLARSQHETGSKICYLLHASFMAR
jgi:hypothetical protein